MTGLDEVMGRAAAVIHDDRPVSHSDRRVPQDDPPASRGGTGLSLDDAGLPQHDAGLPWDGLTSGAGGRIKVGVDLGTAYTVVLVLDEHDRPLAGASAAADVVRDGVVVDFTGAVTLLRSLIDRVTARLGRGLQQAHGAYPPGIPEADARPVRHVIEACGLECSGLVDEPTAANAVLGLGDGVVVDVGGGTTGIAVVRGGAVVHTGDEPTGGHHFSLVVAGALGVSLDVAEKTKADPARQAELFPLVRPVIEKVGAIVARHTADWPGGAIHLVGGAVAFPGFAEVVTEVTGRTALVPPHPLLVTPLGIARSDSPP